MESLSHTFFNVEFNKLMKALLRKYLTEEFKEKSIVLELDRILLNKDELLIYRVHNIKYFFYDYFFLEKIIINRINKTYHSKINTKIYKEECIYTQNDMNVQYLQIYDAIAFLSKGKKEVFEKGCQVVERILNTLKH
jgi:hypothetical protein